MLQNPCHQNLQTSPIPQASFLDWTFFAVSPVTYNKTALRVYCPNIYTVFQDPDDDDEEEMCTCIVSLMQKGRRAMRDEGLDTLTIGFSIYHLADPDSAPKPLDTDHMRYNRAIARSKVFVNLREVSYKN